MASQSAFKALNVLTKFYSSDGGFKNEFHSDSDKQLAEIQNVLTDVKTPLGDTCRVIYENKMIIFQVMKFKDTIFKGNLIEYAVKILETYAAETFLNEDIKVLVLHEEMQGNLIGDTVMWKRGNNQIDNKSKISLWSILHCARSVGYDSHRQVDEFKWISYENGVLALRCCFSS
jgi:hypothetical protein